MDLADQSRYMLALKAMAENVNGWRRTKVRVLVTTPNSYHITGYKDGQFKEHHWEPADPENPKMPDGSEWR